MNAADYYGLDELKNACSGFIQVKPRIMYILKEKFWFIASVTAT